MALVTLDQTGCKIKSVGWRGEKLRVNFGGGYGASAIVGPAHGLHKFMMSGATLPLATTHGTISGVSWLRYYYEFFIARTTGAEETFKISWDARTWHVKFAEVEIDFERSKGDIFSQGGLELVQVRRTTENYNADGSWLSTIP